MNKNKTIWKSDFSILNKEKWKGRFEKRHI